MDELDELIEGLNVRGVREHELKEKLVHARERIVRSLRKAPMVVGKLVLDDDELAKIEKKETKKVNKIFFTCGQICMRLTDKEWPFYTPIQKTFSPKNFSRAVFPSKFFRLN